MYINVMSHSAIRLVKLLQQTIDELLCFQSDFSLFAVVALAPLVYRFDVLSEDRAGPVEALRCLFDHLLQVIFDD